MKSFRRGKPCCGPHGVVGQQLMDGDASAGDSHRVTNGAYGSVTEEQTDRTTMAQRVRSTEEETSADDTADTGITVSDARATGDRRTHLIMAMCLFFIVLRRGALPSSPECS